jgi:RNA polymerase sigma factor (TIGR02999 family)
LRRVAAQRLAREKLGQTLEPNALVHEVYLRLVGKKDQGPQWRGRAHFFAAAAESMRRILIENARRKAGPRHGGRSQRVDADLYQIAVDDAHVDLLDLDEALSRLAEESPAQVELL